MRTRLSAALAAAALACVLAVPARAQESQGTLPALEAAFGKAFDGSRLDLDRRVVLIHGVGDRTALPPSVASLGPIPAHVTLPIACGAIER